MNNVRTLMPVEYAPIQLDALDLLKSNLGEGVGQDVISRAAEAVVDRMDQLETALDRDDLPEVAKLSRRLARIADHIGMHKFARIAEDLEACAKAADRNALAAISGRLQRVGQLNVCDVVHLSEENT
ncbi:MAG: hypothetical protein AAF393_15105 [Pseudomonadota bacterium]